MNKTLFKLYCGLFLALTFLSKAHATPVIPTDPKLNESIEFVKNNRLFAVNLEVTVFKPDGVGPFPVIVINHGKAAMNNRLQARSRYTAVAREFLMRGYAVVLPMRQGFSNSGGAAVGEGCNITGNGEAQADDLIAVTNWLKSQAWVDVQRMAMMGQSHGGVTTLAYAQQPDPGYKAFVNFAGGLRWSSGGCQWQENLKRAFASYGSKTKVPSIWFYGANDSLFPPNVIRPAFDAYVAAGGKAELVAYPEFEEDAHGMFGNPRGFPIWLDKVTALFEANGLPTAITQSRFGVIDRMPKPATTAFAVIGNAAAVPCKSDACRDGYQTFLTKRTPRAFAMNGNGSWAWAFDGDDPLKRALDSCHRNTKDNSCKLYAVDEDIVWMP